MYKKSKYTPAQNQEWMMVAYNVLCESSESMTNEEIRHTDLSLTYVTQQKMSRLLNQLVEDGYILKSKGRDGRTRYKAVEVLVSQGYDIDSMVY